MQRKRNRLLYLFQVDESKRTPKYRQIVRSVVHAIKRGDLKVGEKLPSINEVSVEFLLARETVVKAYNDLREIGIVVSKPGKGIYVRSDDVSKEYNVFLMFNKLSPHKKVVYDAFVKEMGKDARVRLFIYNNDFETFKRQIEENKGNFTHYIIISHFYGVNRPVNAVLKTLPRHQLIILDRKLDGLTEEYPAIYQDFANDISQALETAKSDLRKYQRINMVFPASSYHPDEIKKGFIHFCEEAGFDYRILHHFEYKPVHIKEAYILLEENDLLALLQTARDNKLKLGKDIGVISYNETPLKEFIANGLSVVSTDFEAMGTTAAQMVKKGEVKEIGNPFRYIKRKSL
ncbi:MAG: transcriptional regulator [Thalassobius sp.]|nr:transcriptional regulator [Thalassovita sp.]